MAAANEPPGPDAHLAFRLGMISGVVVGLAVLGYLYWFGALTLIHTGYALFAVFPVYLVFVASALSVWLDLDADPTDLRPVYREKKSS